MVGLSKSSNVSPDTLKNQLVYLLSTFTTREAHSIPLVEELSSSVIALVSPS